MGEEVDMPKVGTITLLLLIYADDVVFFSHHANTLQKMINVVSDFCRTSGLAVNVTKTKVMVIKTHHKGNQPVIMYNGANLRSWTGSNTLALIYLPTMHGGSAQKKG